MRQAFATSSDVLQRPRLASALNQLPRDGVALVSAPSGYGKTILLRSWVGSRPHPAAMVRLQEGDSDPAVLALRIWSEWSRATARHGVCLGGEWEVPKPASLAQLLHSLVRHCRQCPVHHELALDDLHRLPGAATVGALATVLDQSPGRLRLLLSSREDPPLPWLALRSDGRLVEIRAADLAFDAVETSRVLRTALRDEPSDDVVAMFTSVTEGWPAGVRIALLETSEASDPAARLSDPDLARRFARHFFEPDVLEHLKPELVDFLEATAVVDDLRPSLCDSLTGRSDSDRVLADLTARGIFTEQSSEAQGSYAYHPLFREALTSRLRRRDPRRHEALLAHASHWCEQAGFLSEAIEYAIRAGDGDRAASLVADESPAALAAGQVTTVARWVDHLPRDVVRGDLRLTLLEASVFMVLFDRGRFRAALHHAQRMAGTARATGDQADDPAHVILLFLCANDALMRGQLDALVPPLERALACLDRLEPLGLNTAPPGLPVNRDSLESALATALLLAGDLTGAITFADRTLRDAQDPNLTALLRALGTKALALAWQGEDIEAAELSEEALSLLAESRVESNDPFLVHLASVWTMCHPARTHDSLVFVRKLAQRSEVEAFRALSELASARYARVTGNRPASHRAHAAAVVHIEALDEPGVLVALAAQAGQELAAAPQPDLGDLSDREIEVLSHLAAGATRGQIAQAMQLSIDTVKTHLRRSYRKLGVDRRDEALRRAAEVGLLSPPHRGRRTVVD